jgi:hypothetical protein
LKNICTSNKLPVNQMLHQTKKILETNSGNKYKR